MCVSVQSPGGGGNQRGKARGKEGREGGGKEGEGGRGREGDGEREEGGRGRVEGGGGWRDGLDKKSLNTHSRVVSCAHMHIY